jgi:hypothetical protein
MVRVFSMEGETKMTPIPALTDHQIRHLKLFFVVYTAWVVTSIVAYFYILPEELSWVAYGPAVFILLAFIITGICIAARPIIASDIECVYVNHKRTTCCQFCSMAEINDNIVNNKFPVVKCMETAKVCYNPMKIPRWCPYAKK